MTNPNESRSVDYAHIEQLMRDSGLFADASPPISRVEYYETVDSGQARGVYDIRICESTPELLDDSQEKLQTFIAGKCCVDAITAASDRKEGEQWVRDIRIGFIWSADGLTRQSARPVDYESVRKLVHDSGLDDSLRADGDLLPIKRTHYHISGHQATAFFEISISGNSGSCLDELQKKLRAHVASEIGIHSLETVPDVNSGGSWFRTITLEFKWHANFPAGCRT